MKKVYSIRLNPEINEKAKEIARAESRSVSNLVELLISQRGKNQLAHEILNETQVMRPIWNYLTACFIEIKGKKVGQLNGSMAHHVFDDPIQFVEFIEVVAATMKESFKNEMLDDPKGFIESFNNNI